MRTINHPASRPRHLTDTPEDQHNRRSIRSLVRAVGLLLLALLRFFRSIWVTCRQIPLVHAAYVPHDESRPHAHALTSTILFNGPTVSKIYAPGLLPRALYWLAFQAEFPYMRNQAALRAAVLRRNLAGRLTEYWYGTNRVARAIGIDEVDGRFAIKSEFVAGGSPTNQQAARDFLFDLANRFDDVGLPTWQVDPRQPRARDNILETPDGQYQIIDLESGLVSPMASPRAWRRAFDRGLVPLYDDVFFDLTRAYITREEEAMRAQKGDAWLSELLSLLDGAEAETRTWHEGEPRVWSRIVRRVRHPLATRTRVRRAASVPQAEETGRRSVRHRHLLHLPFRSLHEAPAEERKTRARSWFEANIDAWRREGRISDAEAVKLNQELDDPQFLAVLPHFGVHLTIGMILRFPIGSITRASYTMLNLLLATLRLLTRIIDRHQWRQALGIHSPLVILIAGMPGIGTFAYLASRPFRSNHLLLRVGLDAALLKLPWRIYERTGFRWLNARPTNVADEVSIAKRSPIRLIVWAQSIVLALGFVLGGLFAADLVSKFANELGILGEDTMGWKQLSRMLDLGAEQSFGTWYAVITLVLLSAILAVITVAKYRENDRFRRHWLILALLPLAFSIDEQAKIHDAGDGTESIRESLNLGGPLFYGWVIIGLLSVIVVALFYRRFVASLPRTTRYLFILAAALFAGGEIGLESLSGWYLDAAGESGFAYRLITSFEEFLGMAGIFVAIAAVLHYAQNYFGEIQIALSDPAIGGGAGADHLPGASRSPDPIVLPSIDAQVLAFGSQHRSGFVSTIAVETTGADSPVDLGSIEDTGDRVAVGVAAARED